MTYIENVYICLAAPILVSIFCMRGRGRSMMGFVLSGMTVCLLSSYISTFFAAVYSMDYVTASITVAPVVEEVMKFLPVLFCLLIFEPEKHEIPAFVIMTAVGFATLENVCYLTQNGTSEFLKLLIRGFGTGAMHVICGAIMFSGLLSFWDQKWIRAAGTVGVLAGVVTYHSIYNMLVLQTGAAALVGYLIPVLSAIIFALQRHFAGSQPHTYSQDPVNPDENEN